MSAIGQLPHRADVLSVSLGFPCVVVTTAAHGFSTHDFVRFTNMNGMIPVPRGMDQINNNKYRIIVTDLDTFTLQDPITYEDIDSTNFTPYTEGGEVNLVEPRFFYYGDTLNDSN